MHKKISGVVEQINIADSGCLALLHRAHKPPRMSNVCHPQSLHYITQHEKHNTDRCVGTFIHGALQFCEFMPPF